ncbi:hypothetical protein C477_02855 [Haloterrigena salina JCM 13891]|uniref:Uncharacterized protein n=1 Tax=Haloterrigena salina JCM 13891 TaxID=1227488 RepID=M0CK87_9EURY|nr:hypothetical protein [Haloterrigena salina]ELZ23018.1 hypothetical protein C477_02855 [Haloterrigena salina JCM 13891]
MGARDKMPISPWADPDAPAECSKDGHTTADVCDCNARWKWSYEEYYVTGEQLDMFLEDPKYRGETTGRTFIQQEDDPYAFLDGDGVVCPETGEAHPAFIAILTRLGMTYTDISTSASSAHGQYIGEILIEDKGQVSFEIATEPWAANEDVPVIEIYANKHVNVTTGKHVPGTPLETKEWDADVLETILKANGYEDEPEIEHDTDRDRPEREGYEAEARDGDERASDVRNILLAVDRIEPRDMSLSTTQTGTDSTGWTTRDPSYRRSESGKSLHYNGEGAFHDFREGEAFGVLSLFAAEQGIINNPWDPLSGSDWWEAVDAARDAGAPIPEFDAERTRNLFQCLSQAIRCLRHGGTEAIRTVTWLRMAKYVEGVRPA